VLIPDPDDAIHFVLAQYLRVPGWDDAGRQPMATADTSPVLYVIACGAGPARQLPAFVRAAQGEGWDVCVITTLAGTTFLDADRMAELTGLTGHPVRVHYKHPDEPDVLPPADAFAIAPATFNTINKLAAGISDTLALGLLNEAVGLGLPIVAAPWPNSALARHPVFQASVARLRDWGVRVILDPSSLPGAGDKDAAVFPWPELRAALPSLRGYDAP
jgi:hypothetical protein